jgi:hypothetical protein
MSEDDSLRRFAAVNGIVVPARDGYTLGATVQMTQDELCGPGYRRGQGRSRVTWLEIIKGGKTQINIRLDWDQALTLAEAIIGPGDGTGLLTRDQAIKQVAAMIHAWAITREELESERYRLGYDQRT